MKIYSLPLQIICKPNRRQKPNLENQPERPLSLNKNFNGCDCIFSNQNTNMLKCF